MNDSDKTKPKPRPIERDGRYEPDDSEPWSFPTECKDPPQRKPRRRFFKPRKPYKWDCKP